MTADKSMSRPSSFRRRSHTLSNCSRLKPIGSLWVWQEAQVGVVAWAINRSRTVRSLGLLVSLTMEKSTFAGDISVGSQRKISIRATPRLVGELRPGWENKQSNETKKTNPQHPTPTWNS